MKSIEERLREIRNAVALIIAGLSVDPNDVPAVSRPELDEAMLSAAARAHEEAYWLSRLPAGVLNSAAPTDDEMNAGGAR